MKKVAIAFLFISNFLSAQISERNGVFYPDSFLVNFDLGLKALDERQFKSADSLFTLSLKYSESIDAYYNRAAARQNIGNKLGFCEDVETATRMGDYQSQKYFDKYCVRIDTSYFVGGVKTLTRKNYDYYEIRKSCTQNANVYIIRKDKNNIGLKYYIIINGDTTDVLESEEPVTFCEEMPSFKGGEGEMMFYINKHIIYPIKERDNGIAGDVYVTFVVEKDGSITNIRVLKGVANGSALDAEAVRVIKSMPKWNPGKQFGRPVRVQYNLPVRYAIR